MKNKAIECSHCGSTWIIPNNTFMIHCPKCDAYFDKRMNDKKTTNKKKIKIEKPLPKDFAKQIDEVTEKLKSKAFK